jgi:hypothetical protein
MSKQIINLGNTANDRTGDPLRTAFTKVNENFDELYNLIGSGSASFPAQTGNVGKFLTTNGTTVSWATVPPGAIGPKGDKGDTGNTGLKGDKGDQGNSGTPGTPGADGADALWNWQSVYSSGPQYQLGDIVTYQGSTYRRNGFGNSVVGIAPPNATYWEAVAAKGDQGTPGTNGTNGADGAPGQDGAPGTNGSDGAPGQDGAPGTNGTNGTNGAPGRDGIDGAPGQNGLNGTNGTNGTNGSKGDKGDTGAQGVSVILQGTKALIADLPAAPVNPADFAGHGWIVTEGGGDLWFWNLTDSAWNNVGPIVGPQGNKGDSGDKGDKGNNGDNGVNGLDGRSAYELAVAGGFVGTQAAWLATLVGAPGADGTNGTNGADGAPGQDGAPGTNGSNGAPGTNGSDGAPGQDGAPGADALWNFTGAYGVGASYAVGDVATYEGETWYRINANGGTTGNTPVEGIFWTKISEKGAAGVDANPDAVVNGVYNITLDTTGDFVPSTDNLQDLGSPTNRFRSVYVGPGSVYVGTSVITESATGSLVLPGVTRATGYYADEVEKKDRWGSNPTITGPVTVIDAQRYRIISGQVQPSANYSPATYISQKDNNKIDEINVSVGGGSWTKVEADYARDNNMYATNVSGAIATFNAGNWQQIPFRVEVKAEDTEYEDIFGGGTTLPSQSGQSGKFLKTDGEELSWADTPGGNTDLGDFSIDGNELSADSMTIKTVDGELTIESDSNAYVKVAGGAKYWSFANDGNLTLPENGDILNSNGSSVLGGGPGGGLSISDFGRGFVDNLDAGKITTSKLYNENPNQVLNNQYTLEVTNGGVVVLPDGSIINGATLKTIAGNYAGITAGPASPAGKDEDSWVWVDNDGATIATKYSTTNNQWKFNNTGGLVFPDDTVQTTAYTGQTGGSSTVVRQDTAPTAANGTLWFNTVEGRLYIKYSDVWVDAAPLVQPAPDTDIDVASITFPDASVQTTAAKLDRLVNGSHQVLLNSNGDLISANDIITVPGGRFIKDCGDSTSTTSMRWINLPVDDSTQIIRLYTSDSEGPDADNSERAQIGLEWQTPNQSGLSITSFDYSDGVEEHKWTFNGDGSLSFPTRGTLNWDNGIIVGPTLQLGNDPTQQTIITGPAATADNQTAQRLVIQGQSGWRGWPETYQQTGAEGGDVYIWGGYGGEGSDQLGDGGDVKLRGGAGGANGGYIRVEAGEARSYNGVGGFLDLNAGDALSGQGGSANAHGGNVNIRGGLGYGYGGDVNIQTASTTTHNRTWTFSQDGSTVIPENTLKGYCFTATNATTNYLPQSGSFMYTDNPILRLISTIGGAWYIKGPGLSGWKPITAVQDNGGVALIIRIGNGIGPLPDGSEFPAGGGNVYTISQYLDFDLKVAEKTWTFDKDSALTLPSEGAVQSTTSVAVKTNHIPYYSNQFDGSQSITIADSEPLRLGDSITFTIECWVRVPAYYPSKNAIIVQKGGTKNVNYATYQLTLNNETVTFNTGTGSGGGPNTGGKTVASATPLPLNQWVHIAVVFNGTTIDMYQNGVSVGTTAADPLEMGNNTDPVTIGTIPGGAANDTFAGKISNLRIIKNMAVYTEAFTPSINPLTSLGNTNLLTCNAATITPGSGDATVINESPWGAYGDRTWTFGTNGSITFPDNTVQTTAFTSALAQGQYTWSVDGSELTKTLTTITYNLFYLTPASGYLTGDDYTLNIVGVVGSPGQRLVVFRNATLCNLTVLTGDGNFAVADYVPAEFIYISTIGWAPLYGATVIP